MLDHFIPLDIKKILLVLCRLNGPAPVQIMDRLIRMVITYALPSHMPVETI